MVKREHLRGSDVERLSLSRVSTASSVGSRKSGTPLPPVNGVFKTDYSQHPVDRGHNSVHNMQEVQQLTKVREQNLLRSVHHSSSSDAVRMPSISEAGAHCQGKREEKRRRRDLLDISEASEKLAGSADRMALLEAKAGIHCEGKREQKTRRKRDLLDISEASEKLAGSANRMAMLEAKAGIHCEGKMEQKTRRKRDMMDISEASETMTGSSNRMALQEAKAHIQAGAELSMFPGKLPNIKPKVGSENNVLDVINRHEASVMARSKVKEISQGYMNAVSESFPVNHANTAPEIIAKYEERVGHAYRGLSYNEYAQVYQGQRSRSTSRPSSSERRS